MDMKLVGMLDSPFVRRVAITMRMLGVEYRHESRSVVADYESFKSDNPLAKVPTLVCDDGEMMIDSSLIINYLEAIAGHSLMPESVEEQRRALQVIAVSLLGMEKIAHRIYETQMRPDEFQYEPWLKRILEQIAAAFDWLEEAVAALDENQWFFGDEISQADVSVAVAWRFLQFSAPSEAKPEDRPALLAFGNRAEALPEFVACPLE
jgi:glutathione S-transferase